MFRTVRGPVLALLCTLAMSGGIPSAFAIETLDTSKLPRLSNGKDVFASEPTTIFTTAETVAEAGEKLTAALTALGWQPYIRPFSSNSKIPNMEIMSFKKGPLALSVYIAIAPAQGNATSVSYNAIGLANELPFPHDATDIAYDPERPHLNFITAASVEDTLAFFRKELEARGWSPWTAKERIKTSSSGTIHDKGGFAYYVGDGKKPMLLTLQRIEGDRLKAELKAIPNEMLLAQSRKPDRTPAEVAAAPAKPDNDPLAEETKRKAIADIREQIAGIRKEIAGVRAEIAKEMEAATGTRPNVRHAQAVPPSPPAHETRRPLLGGTTPIPLPEQATDVDFDGDEGQLDFRSPSNVRAIATFYRAQMKPLGWHEIPSVINRPNMTVLDFSKGGKTVSLTIMQMGNETTVRATGSGLVTAAARTEPTTSDKASTESRRAPQTTAVSAPPLVIYKELEVEEVAGLPAPKSSSSKGSEKTPFRLVVSAQVNADFQSVLAFYRRELEKRGWKEQDTKVKTKPGELAFGYVSPEGPAVLKLSSSNEDTAITLTVRKPAEAQKAGVLPKPGQSKLLFGNMMPAAAVVTINNKTVKVGAGVGAKAPDGPTLDLPPGKYKFSFKAGNAPAQSDEIEIAADETWGILIGPGGALALHAY